MSNESIKTGDVVKVKQKMKESKGGPEMLVLSVGGAPEFPQVSCFWFDKQLHGESHVFSASLLELVRSAKPPKPSK